MLLQILSAIILIGQDSAQAPESAAEVSFVAPDEYAIRRFNEVVDAYQKDEPKSARDRLIRQRALSVLAKRKLEELKMPSPHRALPNTPLGLRRENIIKSLEAQVHHHDLQIERLENLIKKNR